MPKVTDPEILKMIERRRKGPARDKPVDPPPEVVETAKGEDFSFRTMAGNVWPSAKQYASDLVHPILNPIDTASGMANLLGSAFAKGEELMVDALPESAVNFGNRVNNAIADSTGLLVPLPETKGEMVAENTEIAEAVGGFYGDRYGGLNEIKRTLMQDPVGATADASALLTLGGSALPKLLGKASTVGRAIEPVNLLGNAMKQTAASVIPKTVPDKLYRSAAKFSTAPGSPDPIELAYTALENKLPPTPAGVGKLEILVSNLGDTIDAMIKAADTSGVNIPRSVVFKHLGQIRKELGGAKLGGGESLKTVDKIAKKFDEHMKRAGKDGFSIQELNDFKRDIYADLTFKRTKQKGTRAAEKTKKAIARAAKEVVEQEVPGVRGLNAEMGRLLELKEPLMRSANRIGNRNPISIDTGLSMGAGGHFGAPGAATGLLTSLLAYPKVQSGLAFGLYDAQKRAPIQNLLTSNVPLTTLNQGLLQSGRLEDRGLLR